MPGLWTLIPKKCRVEVEKICTFGITQRKVMKSILLSCIVLFLSMDLAAQPFNTSISPKQRTLLQGDLVSTDFNIHVAPPNGFSATIYYTLILPPVLQGVVTLEQPFVNSPYPIARINVKNSNAVPSGVHKVVLKSSNGQVEEYDTCTINMTPNYCPDWFIYNAGNSPMTGYVLATDVDQSGNYWIGSHYGPTKDQGLTCFDRNEWYVWGNYGLKKYDVNGAVLLTDPSQTTTDKDIRSIAHRGDTVYAISLTQVYCVINKSLTPIASPVTGVGFTKILVDHYGYLWLTDGQWVWRLVSQTWNKVDFSAAPFAGGSLQDFAVDHSGNLWCVQYISGYAENGTIHRYDGTFWTTFTASTSAIAVDDAGKVWTGTSPGHTSPLRIYNPVSNTFQGLQNPWFWVGKIQFHGNNLPVISGGSGAAFYNGSQFTRFDETNSPVWSGAASASMDKWDNLIVAHHSTGFIFHCGGKQSTVGIAETASPERLRVAPNPSCGSFRLIREKEEKMKVTISDAGGRLVYSHWHEAGDDLNIHVTAGFYFLSAVTESGEKFAQKLIITD